MVHFVRAVLATGDSRFGDVSLCLVDLPAAAAHWHNGRSGVRPDSSHSLPARPVARRQALSSPPPRSRRASDKVVAQIFNLSVSVGIVASRANLIFLFLILFLVLMI